jgi:hypothetical protein
VVAAGGGKGSFDDNDTRNVRVRAQEKKKGYNGGHGAGFSLIVGRMCARFAVILRMENGEHIVKLW